MDAWTVHDVNHGSKSEFGNHTPGYAHGKLDYTNEMEYQPGSPHVLIGNRALTCIKQSLGRFLDFVGVLAHHTCRELTWVCASYVRWTKRNRIDRQPIGLKLT